MKTFSLLKMENEIENAMKLNRVRPERNQMEWNIVLRTKLEENSWNILK